MPCNKWAEYAYKVWVYATMLKLLTIVTGTVIAGETLALLVGMHWLSPAGNPWISIKNNGFLALDTAVGLGFLVLALAVLNFPLSGIFRTLILLSLLAHVYRDGEYLSVANKFCANVPLLVVNNIKLVGLAVMAILAFNFPTSS
jgi:hypothetical protein